MLKDVNLCIDTKILNILYTLKGINRKTNLEIGNDETTSTFIQRALKPSLLNKKIVSIYLSILYAQTMQ